MPSFKFLNSKGNYVTKPFLYAILGQINKLKYAVLETETKKGTGHTQQNKQIAL